MIQIHKIRPPATWHGMWLGKCVRCGPRSLWQEHEWEHILNWARYHLETYHRRA